MQRDQENLALNLVNCLEGKDETLNILVANLCKTQAYINGISKRLRVTFLDIDNISLQY